MSAAEKLYTGSFHQNHVRTSMESANRVVPELLRQVVTHSIIDVGCGIGTWLQAFQKAGVPDILGVDGEYVNTSNLLIPVNLFQGRNLSEPFNITRVFDLAVSLEVAEHLPPERASGFVGDLCRLAPYVLFSAAIPGQSGTGHINERWQTYWADLFKKNDFVPLEVFGRRFWSDPQVRYEYAQNMVLYCTANRTSHQETVLDVVHPHYWNNIGLRRIGSSLPNAFRMAWNRRLRR
jgi:hypothetical protein